MSEVKTNSVRPGVKPTGLSRLFKAFGNTGKGLRGCWREEAAFRQECFLALGVLPLGLWLGHSGVERALLTLPMLLVIVVELLNSGIEAAIDRIGVERHDLSGLAKDVGSAAVFVSFLILGLSWILVLFGR